MASATDSRQYEVAEIEFPIESGSCTGGIEQGGDSIASEEKEDWPGRRDLNSGTLRPGRPCYLLEILTFRSQLSRCDR